MTKLDEMTATDLEQSFDVTPEQLSEWDKMACNGQLPGNNWSTDVIRGPGRPRVLDEDQVTVSFRIPYAQKEKLERISDANDITMSTLIRQTLERELL
jgi:hypothetical protein